MLLVDSNIIIYASKPEYEKLRYYLQSNLEDLAASAVSMVETLSYELPKSQKRYIEQFFERIKVLPVSDLIVYKARELQEKSKLKAADAIIATTAVEYKAKLITNNKVDFMRVKSLIVINPLDIDNS